MPISLFGEKIARLIANDLALNPTSLETSAAADLAQQGLQQAAGLLSSSLTYFWSKPSSATASASGTSPQTDTKRVKGKKGLKRATELARLFQVVYSESALTNALSSYANIGGNDNRKTELLTEAFAVTQNQRIIQTPLMISDCDHIIQFICHENAEFRTCTVGSQIMQCILEEAKIGDHQIQEEKRTMQTQIIRSSSGPDAVFQSYEEDNAYPSELQYSTQYPPSNPNREQMLTDLATRRCIYTWAQEKRPSLKQEDSLVFSPRTSASAHSLSSTSLGSASASARAHQRSDEDLFQFSPHASISPKSNSLKY